MFLKTFEQVEALRDAETEVAVGKSRESAAISRAENLGDEVHQKEAKVGCTELGNVPSLPPQWVRAMGLAGYGPNNESPGAP